MKFIGGDQQPLLRGILRALAIREQRGADVLYLHHDADVLGREKGNPLSLQAWNGNGWASWTNSFPWTPRVPVPSAEKMNGNIQSSLAKLGLPPPHLRVEGAGASGLIKEALFTNTLQDGFVQEIEWAVRLGGDPTRAHELRRHVNSLYGCPLRDAVQSIANLILQREEFAPITIGSSTDYLAGECILEQHQEKLPPEWRWNHTTRTGSEAPKAEFLAMELSLRGRLFCTSLPYWERVELLAERLELPVLSPVTVKFTAEPPYSNWREFFIAGKGHHLPGNVPDGALQEATTSYWRQKPSLIWAYLSRTLRRTVETAEISE